MLLRGRAVASHRKSILLARSRAVGSEVGAILIPGPRYSGMLGSFVVVPRIDREKILLQQIFPVDSVAVIQ